MFKFVHGAFPDYSTRKLHRSKMAGEVTVIREAENVRFSGPTCMFSDWRLGKWRSWIVCQVQTGADKINKWRSEFFPSWTREDLIRGTLTMT